MTFRVGFHDGKISAKAPALRHSHSFNGYDLSRPAAYDHPSAGGGGHA
jgi:hypothetical protein